MNYLFVALQEIELGLGTGHVVRVKRILSNLSDNFYIKNSVKFLSNCPEYSHKGYEFLNVKTLKESIKKIKNLVKEKKIDYIIFDSLDIHSNLYKFCNESNIVSLGIDTSSNNSKFLDLLINPVIRNKISYFSGLQYSIHYEEKNTRKLETNKLKKIFVCFGGLDYKNHLNDIFTDLLELSKKYHIDVILSDNNKNIKFKKNKNLSFFYKPKNFYELLKKSDVAIISGGILLHEVMYLGIPSLIMPHYQHQKDLANDMKNDGSIIEVYNKLSKESLSNLIIKSFNSELIKKTSLNSRFHDDGFGLRRIISMINIYEYLEWDSNFFKKNIYHLKFKRYTQNINNIITNLCCFNDVDLIYFLCSKKDNDSINLAKKNGFIAVDNRVTFSLKPFNHKKIKLKKGVKIKRTNKKHSYILEKIAKKANWTSRYFNDKNFNKKDLELFYCEWIKKSIVGKLDDLVFHIEIDQKICGFISIKKDGINYGSIGLITIDKKYEGYGLGTLLISHASQYLFETGNCAIVTVVTQEDNIAACAAYDKVGFQVTDKSIWMHKWV